MSMGDGYNENMRGEYAEYNAEGELVKDVSPADAKITRPALR